MIDRAKHAPMIDWYSTRKESEQGADPAWLARYGEASWENALVVFGELAPNAFDTLTDEERTYYALAPRGTR